MKIWRSAVVVSLGTLCLACSERPKPAEGGAPTTTTASPTPDPNRPLPDTLPAIAARVNGQPVPIAGVHKLARKPADSHGKIPLAYRQALEELINRELLFQEALARHLSADDAAIQRDYDDARVGHPNDAEWASYLKGQFLDPQAFRAELRARYTIQALVRQEGEKVPPVSDQEARRYYEANPEAFDTGERIEARQIFFRAPKGSSVEVLDATKARAESVLARLRKGEDFGALAGQVSQDPQSASQGGKLPPFAHGQVELAVELKAFATKPGQITDVIWSNLGYHILRVEERLPSVRLSFDAVRDRIKTALHAQREQKNLSDLIASLRAKATIETYL
jgi:parvulin-like peptidyl-prolyl isomerase